MYNFFQAAHRTGVANFSVLGWEKDRYEIAPWQYQIEDDEFKHMLCGELHAKARDADVIIFQYVHTGAALSTIYALKDAFPDKPILCEIDDDLTDVPTYNGAFGVYNPGSEVMGNALAHVEVADAVIVSTPYLREVYTDRNENIQIVPNCIDIPKWTNTRKKNKPGIRIGWAGGSSHSEDLRILETVIPRIVEAHKDVQFVFVSSDFPDFLKNQKRVKLVTKWARIDKYPQHLASMDFDIGIAPLVDNKFNRAKSNLRWLEYSALGIPTVASNVGHFAETVRDNQDGYLADGPDEFFHKLDRLIRDKKLRKEMGRSALRRISQDFNVDKTVSAYTTILEEVVARGVVNQAPSLMTGVEEAPAIELGPLEIETPAPAPEMFS